MIRRILFILCCQALFCSNVASHEGRPVVVDVKQSGVLIDLHWQVPPVVPAGAEPLVELQDCETVLAPQPGLIGRASYDCEGISTATISLHWPLVNPALATLVKKGGEATFYGPEQFAIPLNLGIANSSAGVNFVSFVVSGIEHILAGPDHLLFVLCMTLLVGLCVGASNKQFFFRLTAVVTGFTVAHSLTLFLATMGWLTLPIPAVEAAIALSILCVCAELISDKRNTLTWRYPGLVAGVFGLLHGLGFASVLGDVGLPENQRLIGLLGFNIGVELGQLAFVAVVCALLWFCLRYLAVDQRRSGLYLLVYGIGSIAGFWFIERIVLF